jgi:hypothetical protein
MISVLTVASAMITLSPGSCLAAAPPALPLEYSN